MAKKNKFDEFSRTILGEGGIADSIPQNDAPAAEAPGEEEPATVPVRMRPSPTPRPAANTRPKEDYSVNAGYVQRSFYLREDLSDSLARIALMSKRSIKAIMNEIVQEFVDKNRKFL